MGASNVTSVMGFTDETTLEEAVFQSLGAASTCWRAPKPHLHPRPGDCDWDGVFDSSRASVIGHELLEVIRRSAST